jgi:epoxyqueuosine reductase
LTSLAVKAAAVVAGFDLCGVARAERHPKLARLAEWVAAGRAGSMTYLADSLEERLDPTRVLPTARSVISLGCVYNTDAPYSQAIADGEAAISRYAWGDDYHDILRNRLRTLVTWMVEEAGPGLEAFSCVDNGPVQERVFAEQAGLGWIGKNTCLINAELGSWLFLAEVFTNAELEPDSPGVDRCGTCTRCLDACPTGAIIEPYAIDATRCLSYLTIEHRGPIDPALRPAIGPQVFGCDLCQDVCPWNRRAVVTDDAAWQGRDGLVFPGLLELCALSDEDWRQRIRGRALRRAGLSRIRRTLAYAASRLPLAAAREALEALARHPSGGVPEVREAIDWARASSNYGLSGRPVVTRKGDAASMFPIFGSSESAEARRRQKALQRADCGDDPMDVARQHIRDLSRWIDDVDE